MGERRRPGPAELTPGWPDVPSPDPTAEVARLIALDLHGEIQVRGVRALAAEVGLAHSVLLTVVAGTTWPSVQLVARLERTLGRAVWPGLVYGSFYDHADGNAPAD